MTEGFSRIDSELCTGCGECTATCPAEAIRGERNRPHVLSEERCVGCGRCVQVCSAYDSVFQEYPTSRAQRASQRNLPSGIAEPLFAAYDRCFLTDVEAALADPNLVIMAQCGPTVCSTVAEDFGLAAGSLPPGRIVAALKKIGFQKVYSFTLPAALAVLELAQELVERLQSGKNLPVINSSCPAGVKFIEQFHPELINHLAVVKSPHQIAGALLKSYVAERIPLDPARIFSVSLGPCTSRKFEASRPEMTSGGHPDVDAVLTTRELAYLIKDYGIDLLTIAEEEFDAELPAAAGMENVYCATGDISQAVLHAAHGLLDHRPGQTLEVKFSQTGTEGVRIAAANLDTFYVKVVALSGLPNAVPYLDAIRAGKNEIAFLEMMACPMGCVSGGGQPKVLLPQDKAGAYAERARLNSGLEPATLQILGEHAVVKRVYRDCLAMRCGDRLNRTLHTGYVKRPLNT